MKVILLLEHHLAPNRKTDVSLISHQTDGKLLFILFVRNTLSCLAEARFLEKISDLRMLKPLLRRRNTYSIKITRMSTLHWVESGTPRY